MAHVISADTQVNIILLVIGLVYSCNLCQLLLLLICTRSHANNYTYTNKRGEYKVIFISRPNAKRAAGW